MQARIRRKHCRRAFSSAHINVVSGDAAIVQAPALLVCKAGVIQQRRYLQGKSAEQVSGAREGSEREVAARLPALYNVLLTLLQVKCTQQVEQLCRALSKLTAPDWLCHCLGQWPVTLAQHVDLVRSVTGISA